MTHRTPPALAALGISILLTLPAALQAQDAVDLSNLSTACLETELDDCRVVTAGYFNRWDYSGAEGLQLIAWQTQIGSTEMDDGMGGFVLFNHDGTNWQVLGTGFDGFFSVPQLNDENVLHIAGYSLGTGALNTDRLYRLEEDGITWTPINMDSWLENVTLPEDLEIWKGVAFDFSNPWPGYVASSGLWRPNDANCCPSGGEAVIGLEIEGNMLVGKDVDYTPPSGEDR